MSGDTVHWADFTAERIIGQKGKNKGSEDTYVLASGITPSGVVHFGNFRETITTDFIARALKEKGKKVRFIFSWDDYDTFRKIPANMPKQDELKNYLFRPIVHTPDPFGEHESYAAHHEKNYEGQLKKVGVEVEAIYQAKMYQSGKYKDSIKTTLEKKDIITTILNKHRSDPLPSSWLPISIYCEKCDRDDIDQISWDHKSTLNYTCNLCKYQGSENIDTSCRIKLPWRMDWPMRWTYEKVDFEPGGKDHSSQGGSYTTAKEIVGQVYGGDVPVYLQYDFVSIKGMGGKMSSSKGNLVTVNDVLEIYTPQMVRWIFASYKPNIDFGLSFDLDVIKNYEDFDRQEKLAFEGDPNDKKVQMAKRVMSLASLDGKITQSAFRPSFRHLCNILQINDGDIEKSMDYYKNDIKSELDKEEFRERSKRAWFWIDNYAPEDFRYRLNNKAPAITLNEKERSFITQLQNHLEKHFSDYKDEKSMHEKIYELINNIPDFTPPEAFTLMYRLLINKEKGPKLAAFLLSIGKDKTLNLLRSVL